MHQGIVMGLFDHRQLFLKALKEAEYHVIITCPWVGQSGLDEEMLLEMNNALSRGVTIEIGWGWHRDIGREIITGNKSWSVRPAYNWKYNGLFKLQELRRKYPHTFKLKLMGTHAKYWVCDHTFAVVGSANILNVSSTSVAQPHEEIGSYVTDFKSIQTLINSFKFAADLAAERNHWDAA
ncbi:MAG: phospholipase D-like domain-containing protein [Microcoleaceae cyanobacterium]